MRKQDTEVKYHLLQEHIQDVEEARLTCLTPESVLLTMLHTASPRNQSCEGLRNVGAIQELCKEFLSLTLSMFYSGLVQVWCSLPLKPVHGKNLLNSSFSHMREAISMVRNSQPLQGWSGQLNSLPKNMFLDPMPLWWAREKILKISTH